MCRENLQENNTIQAPVVLSLALQTFPNLIYYLHKFPSSCKGSKFFYFLWKFKLVTW